MSLKTNRTERKVEENIKNIPDDRNGTENMFKGKQNKPNKKKKKHPFIYNIELALICN